jgi:hypothetical protein
MNAVTGTTFSAKFPVFSGSRFSAKFVKDVAITARITKMCCYDSNNKHWIYFEVIASDDSDNYKVGKQYKKQGKNFYPGVSSYEYPANYDEIAAAKNEFKMVNGIQRLQHAF